MGDLLLMGAGPSSPGAGAFAPTDIPELLIWLEEGQSTLYTDIGRTIVATSNSDPIASIDDLSGNANHPIANANGNRFTYAVPGLGGLDDWDLTPSATCSLTDTLNLPSGFANFARTDEFTCTAIVHFDGFLGSSARYVGSTVNTGNFHGWVQNILQTGPRAHFDMTASNGERLFSRITATLSTNTNYAITWVKAAGSDSSDLTAYLGTVSAPLTPVTNTLTTGDTTNSIEFGFGLSYAQLSAFCNNGLNGGLRGLIIYTKALVGGELTNHLAYVDART